MKDYSLSKAHFALLASSLIFGANYWIAKGLMPNYFNAVQILFLRTSITTGLFWLFGLMYRPDKISKKDLLTIALCSLLGVVINQYLFFEGLRLSRPVEAAILTATSPIFVMTFAAIIIREKVTGMKMAGILLGAAGAVSIVLSHGKINFSSETFTGNIFIVLNICSYSLYLVLIKPVMQRHQPLTVIKWAFLFGFLFSAPFTISSLKTIHWESLPFNIWLSITYVIFATTFLAYLLTIYSLQKLSALTVGFYIYLQPLIAAGMGIILFHESITPIKILAAMMIFSGVYLVNKNEKTLKKGA